MARKEKVEEKRKGIGCGTSMAPINKFDTHNNSKITLKRSSYRDYENYPNFQFSETSF